MTQPKPEVRALLSALRADVPTARDTARVRRKLVSAGMLLGGTAAGTLGATKQVALAQEGAVRGASKVSTASTNGVVSNSSVPLTKVAVGGATTKAWAALEVGHGTLLSSWSALGVAGKSLITAGALALCASYPAARMWVAHTKADPPHPGAPAAAGALHPALTLSGAALAPSGNGGEGRMREAHLQPIVREHPVDSPVNHPDEKANRQAPAIAGPVSATMPTSRPTDGRRFAPAAQARAPQVPPSQLSDEAALIEGALKASRAQRVTRAIQLLAEHERRFPMGALATERERIRVQLRR